MTDDDLHVRITSSDEADDGEETGDPKDAGEDRFQHLKENMTEEQRKQVEESGDGAYGFEWKTIDEAIEQYEDDRSTKFLLCIETMSSFTSTISAENHADDEDAEVWAAAEDLPDDFLQ